MSMSASPHIRSAAIAHSRRILRSAVLACICAAGVGCATTAADGRDARRLADVMSVAGKPVSSFRYMSMSSFEPIGDSDLLVFTSPRDAWLLHLDGSCRNLEFDPFLGLTSSFGRVQAGFDKVLVRDNQIPCRIEQIRRVDTAVLRRVDHEHKMQAQPEVGQKPPSG